jgi:hypothetical protein
VDQFLEMKMDANNKKDLMDIMAIHYKNLLMSALEEAIYSGKSG